MTLIYLNIVIVLVSRVTQIEEAVAGLGDLPVNRLEQLSEGKVLLKNIVQFLLACYINKVRHGECEGCIRNYPSLRDHSCLMGDIDYQIDKCFQTYLFINSNVVYYNLLTIIDNPIVPNKCVLVTY